MKSILIFLFGMMVGGTVGIFTLCLFQIHRPSREESPEPSSGHQKNCNPLNE